MAEFFVKCLQVGLLETNCSLLVNRDTKEAVIFDPGDEADGILAELKGAEPVAIVLTHAHYDHTMAVGDLLRKRGQVPVIACEKEKRMFEDRSLNCPPYGGVPSVFMPDTWVSEGEVLSFAGAKLRVLETPGHTAGSMCLFLDQPVLLGVSGKAVKASSVLFAGDTLFFHSHGRTDFPTGSEFAMWKSLRRILTELPTDTIAIPGHGPLTTIGNERRFNRV